MERAHIHQEYHILFPLAEQVIPPETQDRAVAMFKHIERETIDAGTYEFYRSTVAALEREAWTGQ